MEITEFKVLVEKKTGIPTSEQMFIHGGKQLQDENKLDMVGNHATLFMVMRLPGGSSNEERLSKIDKQYHTDEPCMISYEDGAVTMPCDHAITPSMLMEYSWREIESKKYEIRCPLCNSEWSVGILAKYGGADANEITLMEEGLSVNYCKQNDEITQCPGCNCYCTRTDKTKYSMMCRVCTKSRGATYRFCFKCHADWNNGSNEIFCGNKDCGTADQAHIEILNSCEEKEVVGVKCPSIRECPNVKCKVRIMHKEACKHMTCNMCKTEFCFICLRKRIDGCWHCGSYNTPCIPAPRQV